MGRPRKVLTCKAHAVSNKHENALRWARADEHNWWLRHAILRNYEAGVPLKVIGTYLHMYGDQLRSEMEVARQERKEGTKSPLELYYSKTKVTSSVRLLATRNAFKKSVIPTYSCGRDWLVP